jgi:hypothetical protein
MFAAPRPAQRLCSFLLVLLLHGFLLFALLHFLVQRQTAIATAPEHLLEMIISTARPPAPVPQAAPPRRLTPAAPIQGGEHSGAMPSLAPPVAAPDITGLGQALLGCAPENIPNLTPDQRAHCTNVLGGGGFTRPDENAVIEPKSHVKDPVRRAAEMRARNTPGRIPCTSVTEAPAPHGSVAAPMVDPFCVIGGLLNGFGPLSGLAK